MYQVTLGNHNRNFGKNNHFPIEDSEICVLKNRVFVESVVFCNKDVGQLCTGLVAVA